VTNGRTPARVAIGAAGLLALMACSTGSPRESVDYRLGAIGAFGEMVDAGVKKIALSATMTPAEMDAMLPAAEQVAQRNNVQLFREPDLIQTDLFPSDVAAGKEVLLIYKGSAKAEYLSIKAEAARLDRDGKYAPGSREREAISRQFARLLGYPTDHANALLAANSSFRTMQDFGIRATNLFLYYKDLDRAEEFYTRTLGFEKVADYQMAKILRLTADSYLILVDATKGMHTAAEPKTVAIALLTDKLEEWHSYLASKGVSSNRPFAKRPGGPHDGFVVADPEGYLLEFEWFNPHAENENFLPLIASLSPVRGPESPLPAGLGFRATITWLYYKDMVKMQEFYEEVLGLRQVVDQGWAKVYQGSKTGFVGLVDERRGMHQWTEKKAVNVSFLVDSLDGWFERVRSAQRFPLRGEAVSRDSAGRYHAFVGFDPEGYYMEFDRFFDHASNTRLTQYLGK
jgi:catechol 2,3-dioxygenase-like lactoylglutathione lyase family enzyme